VALCFPLSLTQYPVFRMRLTFSLWERRQQHSSKCQWISTRLDGVTSRKTFINAVRTSHLINYKQTSARYYSFYSNWRRCRISLSILALLSTYFHEFSQYFSHNYSAFSRIFYFFASAHSDWGAGCFSRKMGPLLSGILHFKLNGIYLGMRQRMWSIPRR